RGGFGKGVGGGFFDFVTGKMGRNGRKAVCSCQNGGKGGALGKPGGPNSWRETPHPNCFAIRPLPQGERWRKSQKRGNAMDQSLKGPVFSALDDAFHAQLDASRADPMPSCEVRIDRLRRLRAAIEANEARFEQAISADFGHRSAVETTIAETL